MWHIFFPFIPLRWLPCPTFQNAQESGKYGEKVASSFLRAHGYKVLVRNYRSDWGEIDIVCRHKNVLVFAEVKARSGNIIERPAQAVDEEKQKRIIRTAHAYLRELDDDQIISRFDIVEIYMHPGKRPHCEILKAAFTIPSYQR